MTRSMTPRRVHAVGGSEPFAPHEPHGAGPSEVHARDDRRGPAPEQDGFPGSAPAGEPAAGGRLDAELVRRGLARSRKDAAAAIAAGRVAVRGVVASRSSQRVGAGEHVEVSLDADDPGYASRAAHKLVGALDATGVEVTGRRCLDAGASTGGFTDVLLRRGARRVVAVDVGHDQIIDRLRHDERVEVREGLNVRSLSAADVGPAPELVVADLSFISLTLVLPALRSVAAPGADFLVMVKPQFEVGRDRLGSGGVVRDPALRADAVLEVARAAARLGLATRGVVRSPLPGPSGNVEYFLWLRAEERADLDEERVRAAVVDDEAYGRGGTESVPDGGSVSAGHEGDRAGERA
ncbi:TlyA family RNA methyltransferase [Cellulomonas edaphi]|uniref:TlyA family RNA methyltransferase n=1 Tax=Cellulomonas edaphi TaxID=3053468 RepID=A0ABT7S5M6_9CELL|nr:TlyA family RNA methyltransferase [Cellulomons edaphi]MDM7830925.1 TlyA family RNA methyltransferase [Cellulomons edaphi]